MLKCEHTVYMAILTFTDTEVACQYEFVGHCKDAHNNKMHISFILFLMCKPNFLL